MKVAGKHSSVAQHGFYFWAVLWLVLATGSLFLLSYSLFGVGLFFASNVAMIKAITTAVPGTARGRRILIIVVAEFVYIGVMVLLSMVAAGWFNII